MDKTVLRNFAIESRKDLMEKIDRKIKLFYVDEEFKKDNRGDVIVLSNDKHSLTLTKEEDSNRDKLLRRIVELGYNQVVEEAAYTWFNRIIAIRYMEIHDFLPLTSNGQSLGIKILSSSDNNIDPDILKFSNLDDKFKYILKLICNKLGNYIPQVFAGVTDYIDLLIPDNMLLENGFINNLINNIDINNFKEVEIIGWFYQYYNQTEKDRVISNKKANNKNELAYATQIFTPDWIVKYMVENSLGRYYIEHFGNSSISDNWKYLIKDNLSPKKESTSIDMIKFIDPCSGSGHILVYAYDLFYQMYINEGYNKNDIPELILKNNLYGLDVDDRAGQLSLLSLILKARQTDKNIFNKQIINNLNVMAIQDSNDINSETFPSDLLLKQDVLYLINQFKNAKEIGSLLKIDYNKFSNIDFSSDNNIFDLLLIEKLKVLLKQATILSNKYDVVVTNPPYMNSSAMPKALKNYINDYYKLAKSDMFSAFIVANSNLVKENAYLGFMTPYVWMFISTYESLREYILSHLCIQSLVQLEYSALEEATVPLCTFVLSTQKIDDSYFVRLCDYTGGMEVQKEEYLKAVNSNSKDVYKKNFADFENIPNCEYIYWINKNGILNFKNNHISEIIEPRIGLVTGDSNRFLRFWNEVDFEKINFKCHSNDDSIKSKFKWFPYQKGGDFRKWYGNNSYIVNWYNDGQEMKEDNIEESTGRVKSHNYNGDYAFKEALTWTKISSSSTAFRYVNKGFMFDDAGPICHVKNDAINLVLGLFNSRVGLYYLSVLNPTLNTTPGNLLTVPFIDKLLSKKEVIEEYVIDNIRISKDDWNSFENSWDFMVHPLLSDENRLNNNKTSNSDCKIEEAFANWSSNCSNRFEKMKRNEEEINKILIDMYGLEDVLDYTVSDNEITVCKADKEREIRSLISYAVGCMFGRYSLDDYGLICAGNNFDERKYKKFIPDADNIIPISDNEEVYYNDDIVGRFKEFIKISFGEKYYNDNLNYISEILGKRGTESNEDTIRRYFVNDFYNEHIKTYQKRPIYWLFDSGKKNGFKCLVYLHRYNEQIVSKIRTKYLHNTLSIYQRTAEEIDYKLNNVELSTTDKRELQNKKADLNGKITECNEYEEMVGNVANKMIKLDLDDGVMVNYSKFVDDNGKSILAKIK